MVALHQRELGESDVIAGREANLPDRGGDRLDKGLSPPHALALHEHRAIFDIDVKEMELPVALHKLPSRVNHQVRVEDPGFSLNPLMNPNRQPQGAFLGLLLQRRDELALKGLGHRQSLFLGLGDVVRGLGEEEHLGPSVRSLPH